MVGHTCQPVCRRLDAARRGKRDTKQRVLTANAGAGDYGPYESTVQNRRTAIRNGDVGTATSMQFPKDLLIARNSGHDDFVLEAAGGNDQKNSADHHKGEPVSPEMLDG